MISYDHYTTASINKTVELGSFTKVARVLNMTRPAVSHAISSIESELGVTILIRDKRKGLLVTDVGNRILVHIRDFERCRED